MGLTNYLQLQQWSIHAWDPGVRFIFTQEWNQIENVTRASFLPGSLRPMLRPDFSSHTGLFIVNQQTDCLLSGVNQLCQHLFFEGTECGNLWLLKLLLIHHITTHLTYLNWHNIDLGLDRTGHNVRQSLCDRLHDESYNFSYNVREATSTLLRCRNCTHQLGEPASHAPGPHVHIDLLGWPEKSTTSRMPRLPPRKYIYI